MEHSQLCRDKAGNAAFVRWHPPEDAACFTLLHPSHVWVAHALQKTELPSSGTARKRLRQASVSHEALNPRRCLGKLCKQPRFVAKLKGRKLKACREREGHEKLQCDVSIVSA